MSAAWMHLSISWLQVFKDLAACRAFEAEEQVRDYMPLSGHAHKLQSAFLHLPTM